MASSLPKPEEGLGLVLLYLLASCSSWGTEGQLGTGTEEIQEDTVCHPVADPPAELPMRSSQEDMCRAGVWPKAVAPLGAKAPVRSSIHGCDTPIIQNR